MATILRRVAQHGVLAGDMREAPETCGIGELCPAGLDPLVAARADGEGIALADGPHRSLEQGQHSDVVRDVMAQGEFIDRWPKGFFEERAEELF